MKRQRHPHRCVDCETRTAHYQGGGWFRCSKCKTAWRSRALLIVLAWLLLAPPGTAYLNYRAPLYEWHLVDGPFETLQACERQDEANRIFLATFGKNHERAEDYLARYYGVDAQTLVAPPIMAARIKAEKCVLQEEL